MIRCRTIRAAFLSAGVLVVLASGESLGAAGSGPTGARPRGDATADVPATQRAGVRIRHSAGADVPPAAERAAPRIRRALVDATVPATERAAPRIRHGAGDDVAPSAAADVAPAPAADIYAPDNDHSRPCYADCNADGRLTIADLGCFQTQFILGADADGNAYADCNRDGRLNVADFGCFQTALLRGCW